MQTGNLPCEQAVGLFQGNAFPTDDPVDKRELLEATNTGRRDEPLEGVTDGARCSPVAVLSTERRFASGQVVHPGWLVLLSYEASV